jgi:hypothetical protein
MGVRTEQRPASSKYPGQGHESQFLQTRRRYSCTQQIVQKCTDKYDYIAGYLQYKSSSI